ncbi:MAG: hypothetical protein HRK26_00435 [Rickettsiaceae bacterium H1]|nr:hypothetical protein [Rickettsiaceae bacterium H1]
MKTNFFSCASAIRDEDLVKVLEECSSLINLDFSVTRITGESFAKIDELSNVQILSLNFTKVTNSGLEEILNKCPNLVRLNLKSIEVVGEDFSENGEIHAETGTDQRCDDDKLKCIFNKCKFLTALRLGEILYEGDKLNNLRINLFSVPAESLKNIDETKLKKRVRFADETTPKGELTSVVVTTKSSCCFIL